MFKNRTEAGKYLTNEFQSYRNLFPVVLAIPKGGVETAYHTAININCDFSVVVSDTLRYPLQEKATFGSLAEDGSLYLDSWVPVRLNKDMINRIIKRERKEILRRTQIYRQGKPLADLTDRTVIVIDEGVASGAAMFVALSCCIKRKPRHLIVATPVADKRVEKRLSELADEVIILEKPETFYSVSQVYEEYEKLTDQDVVQRINSIEEKQTGRNQTVYKQAY